MNARLPRPMLINGHTQLIAHLGWPTHSFKAPMIYNPYFESIGINAIVVPMGCKPRDYPDFLRLIFRRLQSLGFTVPSEYWNASYGVYHGDHVTVGRGEIVIRELADVAQ